MRTRRALRGKRVSAGRRRITGSHIKEYLAAKRRGDPEVAGREVESEVDPLSPTVRSGPRPATSGGDE